MDVSAVLLSLISFRHLLIGAPYLPSSDPARRVASEELSSPPRKRNGLLSIPLYLVPILHMPPRQMRLEVRLGATRRSPVQQLRLSLCDSYQKGRILMRFFLLPSFLLTLFVLSFCSCSPFSGIRTMPCARCTRSFRTRCTRHQRSRFRGKRGVSHYALNAHLRGALMDGGVSTEGKPMHVMVFGLSPLTKNKVVWCSCPSVYLAGGPLPLLL